MPYMNLWHVPVPCNKEQLVALLNTQLGQSVFKPHDINVSDGIALTDHPSGHNFRMRISAAGGASVAGSTHVFLTHPQLKGRMDGQYSADDIERDVFAKERVRILLRCKEEQTGFRMLYSHLKPLRKPRTVKQLIERLRRFIPQYDITVLRNDGTNALLRDELDPIRFR